MKPTHDDALERAVELERLLDRGAALASDLAEGWRQPISDDRAASLEAQNRELADRLTELEHQNDDLIKLYVASCQIHASLSLPEVLRSVIEVAINLIGAEKVALFLLDEATNELRAIAAEGGDLDAHPRIVLGEGPIGTAVASQHMSYGTVCDDLSDPLVCIPLWVQDRPLGAIAVYRLLEQKDGLSTVDHEIFTLLARHAATAIYSARLYAQSTRRLDTIQGFIDLLAK